MTFQVYRLFPIHLVLDGVWSFRDHFEILVPLSNPIAVSRQSMIKWFKIDMNLS